MHMNLHERWKTEEDEPIYFEDSKGKIIILYPKDKDGNVNEEEKEEIVTNKVDRQGGSTNAE